MNKHLKFAVFFAIAWLIGCSRLYAAIETIEKSTQTNQPFVGQSVTVADDKFINSTFDWSSATTTWIKNRVYLRLLDFKTKIPFTTTTGTRYNVNLSVITYNDRAHPTVGSAPVAITLQVNYNPTAGSSYAGLAVYDVPDANVGYQMKVTVVSISNPDNAGQTVFPNQLQVSAAVSVNRQYNFDAAKAFSVTGNVSNGGQQAGTTKQLSLSWISPGTQEFDVEWATVDKGSDAGQIVATMDPALPGYNPSIDPTVLDQIFMNNASRITTAGNSYVIALLYNNDFVVARVRLVYYDANGNRKRGNWNYMCKKGTSSTATYNFWPLVWNDSNMNWQYSAAFAEDGKKKEVISYFDGALRGRQTVSINNADNVPVVQENIYDEFGRAAASILPSPYKDPAVTETPSLHYVTNFNLSTTSTASVPVPYSIADIGGTSLPTDCEALPGQLKNTSGTSLYYSANNPFKALNKYNNYIPDAGGYPLAVTQYTKDNTGRVKLQGGVGLTFQPGNVSGGTSHTTKYYYGKPEQWELDEMFGNDAGYAEHYQKNMAIDPNGQASVNYINASGKTVATALTGPVPANLDALAKTGDQNQVTTALLNPSQFSYSSTELKLSATTSYLAPVADNNASLQYNIQELINHYPTTGSFSVCSNCYYDLKVSITDDCGNIIYPAGAAALPSIGSATSLCTFSDPTPTKSITGINFPRPGEYKVTFEFSMSNQVIDNYVDNFVAQSLTSGYLLTQYNYLKQNYLSTVDMSGCFNDCKTCKVMLGGEPDFKQMLTDEFAAQGVDISQVTTDFNSWAHTVYTTLSNKCTSLVSTCDYAPCNTAQQNMLADVSPGGQYALFDNSGNALEPDINVIANNFSTVFANNHPPQTLDPSDVIALDDPTTPQLSVYDPRFNLQMMLKYWNPVWAQKFLPFHPEYCKLRFCQDNQLYENWDEALKYQSNSIAGIANIPGAPATPTYDGTNPLLLLTLDPFFKSTGPGASYYTSMSNDLQSYSTLKLGLTDLAVKSLPQYITYMLNCASTDNTQWGNCSPAASCRAYEKEWLMYRDLYLQCKQKYYELLRNTAPYCGTSTCPIGQPYVAQDPAASMQPADFIIQPYRNDPAGTCDANSQEYSIQYAGGRIPQSVIVNLNNPSINLSFPQGSTLVTFCAPLSTPATAITIRSITSTTNNLSTTDKYLDISEAVTTRIPFTIRAYTGWFFGSHWENFACEQDSTTTTIALRDYQGNLTTSASPITVILTYIKSSAPPSSLSYLQLPFTIPAGKSTLKVTYVSYDNFKTNDSGDPIGVTAMQLSGLSNGGGALPYPGTKTYNFGSNPSSGSCSTAYANKDSRFPSAATNGYQAKELNPSSQITGISDANTALIKGQNNYDLIAGNLITALTPGLTAMSATTTQINNLKTQLIEVCTIGTDPAHPFGVSVLSPPPQGQSASTSTVPPSLTASGNTSFGDAIKHALGITYFTATLNPWLVNSPYPYNAQPIQTAKVIGNSSPQIKAEIDQLKAAYTTATGQAYTLTGFYNYLVATYGTAMSLTSAQLDALITAGTSCNYLLKTDVPLPVFLDPSAAGCILKGDYLAAKTALQAAFNNALSTSHANYQTIYANYMNQRWGFTFSYSDYMAFEAAYTANAATPLCSKPPFIAVDPDNYACAREILESTLGSGVRAYNTYIDDAKKAFRAAYISTCSAAQANISMKVKMPVYQYTLYYYDQADNLVRTVPPEGVRLITDPALLQMVTKARSSGDPASCTGASTIPAGNSPVATAFGAMETAFDGGLGGTIELWLYNASAGSGQVVQTTPQGKYRFQLTLSSSTLTAEIYSSPSFGDFTQKNRVTVNLAGLPPLQAWTHIALISTNFVTAKPQVMVNGVMAPQALTTPDPVLYTPTLTSLKYMRLYPGRKLPAAEVTLNAQNNCFLTVFSDASLFRFNAPVAGSETTVGGTTQETRITGIYPAHVLQTSYVYNSTNQVNKQYTPDGGTISYWYDLISRMVFSQNDKQLASTNYSYTVYEPQLSRITEAGQKHVTSGLLPAAGYLADNLVTAFYTNSTGVNSQITHTYYDSQSNYPTSLTGLQTGLLQGNNLRKQVAASIYMDAQNGPVQQATYYNYDINGNVKTLWQQLNGLGTKQIDYEYDLVSGKMNFVRYQDGKPDAFYYQYMYDADNRLTEAWSGTQALVDVYGGSTLMPGNKKKDAGYYYYLHGPLARVELGDQQQLVQGIDYAYTLQGWLKGVNSTNLLAATDISGDGTAVNASPPPHAIDALDAFGYALHYYGSADYIPIGGTSPFAEAGGIGSFKGLYNGNIAASSVNIAFPSPTAQQVPQLYIYGYDQLNRLTKQDVFTGFNTTTNSWAGATNTSGNYQEAITYDGNGNIKTYKRNSYDGLMDNLTYRYNQDINGNLLNNRLNYITDAVTTNTYTQDIKTQSSNNYLYDAIGNLSQDAKANIGKSDWSVYGKLQALYHVGATTTPFMTYTYDAFGKRTSKTTNGVTTWYVRDAQGNPLAMYDNTGAVTNWREQQLYGSSMLGTWKSAINDINNATVGAVALKWLSSGNKQYQLSNYLDNVLATITDRRLQQTDASDNVQYLTADVVTAQDYYPFGMLQPGRQFVGNSTTAFRYGFNGKENDNDVKADASGTAMVTGGEQDYGMRIYDGRVGRFLSVDPIAPQYPELTPYQFASNSPIKFIDVDGLEAVDAATKHLLLLGQTKIDMSKAPSKFLTSSGRWVYTTTNALGEKRNNAYYWAQLLELHPQFFSERNKIEIGKGYSPIVDELWISFNKSHAPWIGNILEHHHDEHGNEAFALPWIAHRGKGNYKIWHKTLAELNRLKGTTNTSLLNYIPILDPTTWSGYYADRPDSFFIQMEAIFSPKVGKVYENTDDSWPGNYFIIREISKSKTITTYTVDFYGELEDGYDVNEQSFKSQRTYSVDQKGNEVIMN